jgi:transcriptional regulator GlxA family with amidase domain
VRKVIDRALGLIEEDAGRQVAVYVARLLAFCLSRLAGQSQYCTLLAAQARPKSVTFDSLDRWIAEHLTDDLRVEALAERVHMSPRNFARAYAKKRGRTPAKAVEAIRVAAARRLLEETEDRIDFIAEGAGFSCEEQMRCAFIRIVGVPPREYRKRALSRLAASGRSNPGRYRPTLPRELSALLKDWTDNSEIDGGRGPYVVGQLADS